MHTTGLSLVSPSLMMSRCWSLGLRMDASEFGPFWCMLLLVFFSKCASFLSFTSLKVISVGIAVIILNNHAGCLMIWARCLQEISTDIASLNMPCVWLILFQAMGYATLLPSRPLKIAHARFGMLFLIFQMSNKSRVNLLIFILQLIESDPMVSDCFSKWCYD